MQISKRLVRALTALTTVAGAFIIYPALLHSAGHAVALVVLLVIIGASTAALLSRRLR